jgi:CDP-glycerol glycerophosphotransferase (TagB/SpsB family)
MQLLSRNFAAKSENITIGAKGEFDVQTLLRKASLLVTDYSSVFFDFSYMHKPVFFYQFDQDEFFKKHYQRNGEQYPFGETYDSERLLVDKIIKMIISKDYSVNKKCLEDIDGFFEYRDKKNSERNYNTIKELEK